MNGIQFAAFVMMHPLMLIDRFAKMEQEAKIAEAKLENGREEFRLALQATLAQNEKDMNFVLIRAEEENKVAVDMACLEAEERWKEALKEKEREIDAALQKEKNEMADKREKDIATKVTQAVEDERQRTNNLRETITSLKADHGEEMKKLLGVIEENRKKTEALKKNLAKQHESQVIEDMEQEIEKVSDYLSIVKLILRTRDRTHSTFIK
jgi:paraquat-inducible protein B